MKAPLIPGSLPRVWTIVHESGDPVPGFGGSLAFTTRAAFDAWVRGDIVTPQGGCLYGPRGNNLSMEVALLTPNGEILILEEAWGWKFPTPCPQMHSAEDGQAVLRKLLGGKHTREQGLVWWLSWLGIFYYDQTTPEKLLIMAARGREGWQEYCSFECGDPDAVIGPGGELILLRDIDDDYVTFVGKDGYFEASLLDGKFVLNDAVPPVGETLMILHRPLPPYKPWSPQEATRQVPAYIAALT